MKNTIELHPATFTILFIGLFIIGISTGHFGGYNQAKREMVEGKLQVVTNTIVAVTVKEVK